MLMKWNCRAKEQLHTVVKTNPLPKTNCLKILTYKNIAVVATGIKKKQATKTQANLDGRGDVKCVVIMSDCNEDYNR